ncbi:MAG: type II toxin-antitoxin system prevent-host-death family antitoxin [Candidatus Eremiobacteraeota bacterium]|nr:type II toxin-antitoxin system prevent-host-death family antitoxin [Candidatus Eremiobacteraeota bacterium]MBC5824939.1 type II toxin-antitoxin system prevent-host-death family antitoxin [Candidatus Eremiobacteraeota bacterium]
MRASTRHAPRIQSWTLTEAKAKLSSVVQSALDGQPQRITRGGREAVVLVDEATYRAATKPRKTALELFAPLRGASLDLERSRDEGPAALIF